MSNESLFAGRYELQRNPEGWDTGRSGLTTLARDTRDDGLVVIKRAALDEGTEAGFEAGEASFHNAE